MANNHTEKQPLLVGSSDEFNPVDRVAVRRRCRRVAISVAVVCCVGLGLSLAVALPLVNHGSEVAGGGSLMAGDAQQADGRVLMKSAGGKYEDPAGEPLTDATANATTTGSYPTAGRPWWWEQIRRVTSPVTNPPASETDSSTASTRHTFHPFIPTWWPWWGNYTTTTSSSVTEASTSEADASTASTRHRHHPTFPTWPRPWWWNRTKTTPASVTQAITTPEEQATTASTRHRHHPTFPTWPRPWWWNRTETTPASVTEAITTSETQASTASTRHRFHPTIPTWWPWRWNVTTSKPSTREAVTTVPQYKTTTASVTAADVTTQTDNTSTSDAGVWTTASWLPESCPRVSSQFRDRIKLDDIVSTPVWYELLRIQSYNSPAYVEKVSCSTMQLTSNSPLDAEAQLDWEEGRLFHRKKNSARLYLHRQDESSTDWAESVNRKSSSSYQNQFSFLARVDGFLLVYECFPYVVWRPNPGYAIRVFSSDPRPSALGQRVAELLLLLAEQWGLNTAKSESVSIRQRFCDIDVGYA